jgi:hypothetical protein
VTAAGVAYGELTLQAEAGEIIRVLTHLRDDPALPVPQHHRHLRRRLSGSAEALRRGLSPAVAEV